MALRLAAGSAAPGPCGSPWRRRVGPGGDGRRYKQGRELGRGSYGVVHAGVDNASGQSVALKSVAYSPAGGFCPQILREISAMCELDHPNILPVLDVVTRGAAIVLVTPLMESDLRVWMRANPGPTVGTALQKAAVQLADAVRCCHAHRFIHRDIKPQNVLVRGDRLFLSDFGLARCLGPDPGELTREVVTRWYRAPELLLGAETYTPALDIWSTAVVIVELARGDGSPLFPGDSEIDQLLRTFRLLGTPSEDTWRGVATLQDWQDIFPKFAPKPLDGPEGAPALCGDHLALSLLSGMLSLDPAARPSAAAVRAHEWLRAVAPDKPVPERCGVPQRGRAEAAPRRLCPLARRPSVTQLPVPCP